MTVFIITGSRDFTDSHAIEDFAERAAQPHNKFVLGDARGADSMMLAALKRHGGHGFVLRADWKKYGKFAGPERNARMWLKAHTLTVGNHDDIACVAFKTGLENRWLEHGMKALMFGGTEHMVRTAILGNVRTQTHDMFADRMDGPRGRTTVTHIDKRGWTIPIDRRTIYGNPFVVGKDGSRDEVIERYKTEVLPTLTPVQLHALKGQVLACHCYPQACHGDVLAAHVDERWG